MANISQRNTPVIHPLNIIGGPVDRVEHPGTLLTPLQTTLFSEETILWAVAVEPAFDLLFDKQIRMRYKILAGLFIDL